MTNSIVEVFKQAAVRLQDDLLNVLKSKDFHDHESMILEACFIFCALDALFVDSQPFKEQVEEFIGCAAWLAEVELSIDNFVYNDKDLFLSLWLHLLFILSSFILVFMLSSDFQILCKTNPIQSDLSFPIPNSNFFWILRSYQELQEEEKISLEKTLLYIAHVIWSLI